MKKEIIFMLILVFVLAMLSSVYANSYTDKRSGNVDKNCINYNNDMCLKYNYTYEYQCIYYNRYDCSLRKVKFIDKCIIYKPRACKY